MNLILQHWQTLAHAAASAIVVALLGTADYYGYAVLGETAAQQPPGQHFHSMVHFHK